MKRFSIALTIPIIFFFFSNQIVLSQHKAHDLKSVDKVDSSHQHHDKKTNDGKTKSGSESPSMSNTVNAKTPGSMKDIVERYLAVKNALTDDNAKDAAAAGKAMVTSLAKLDTATLNADQKEIFLDVEEDAKEHAEHIGDNAGNIAHQREHFVMLSNDVYDLVKVFGNEQVLYKDYCPMYNNKKGGMWLSETKAINNPYYGKKMLTCGSVKEEIK